MDGCVNVSSKGNSQTGKQSYLKIDMRAFFFLKAKTSFQQN